MDSLKGAPVFGRTQAADIASIAREIRSVAVTDNTSRPRFATVAAGTFGPGSYGSAPSAAASGAGAVTAPLVTPSRGGGFTSGPPESSVARAAEAVSIDGTGLPDHSNPFATIEAEGSTWWAASATGSFIKGMRNRLFLKYAGIDYEFYNVHDLKYRGPPP